MNRQEFLEKLGIGIAGIAAGSAILEMESCKKENSSTTAAVDFTVDLTAPANSALNSNGGSIYSNNIIIARNNSGNFIALSQVCTHQGCTVKFSGTNNNFPCPCHGSIFDANGSVSNGPATTTLKKYNTSLSGNTLRVFS